MMKRLAAIALAGCLCPVVFVAGARDKAFAPGSSFKDCKGCPEMVVLPPGSFMMGSPADEKRRDSEEGPRHRVTIAPYS